MTFIREKKLKVDESGCLMLASEDKENLQEQELDSPMTEFFDDGHNTEISVRIIFTLTSGNDIFPFLFT